MGVRRAAVVGAGFSGLSAAVHLALKGWKVTVVDARGGPGGKAFTESLGAWRFDTGPSLLTMVPVFQSVFAAAGKRLEDYATPVKLDPVCHYWYPDGTFFKAGAGPEGLASSMEAAGIATRSEVLKFLKHAKKIWGIAGDLFLEKPIGDPSLMLSPSFWGKLVQTPWIDAGRTMDKALRTFFRDPRAVQYFSRYATYNGSSPYKVPATLNMIPWVEALGAYGVREGLYALPKALEKLAKELGVEFRYGIKATSIETKKEKAAAVLTEDGQRLEADAVFSAADVHETYRLLNNPNAKWAKKYRKTEPSSSGFVFYWGMKETFPEMALNNIFFSSDYAREFREIFDEHRVPEEPTIYVNIGSKVTPEDAPAGGESWFVLINTPPDSGQDWDFLGAELRERVLKILETRLGRTVAPHIAVEGSWNPRQIETLTSSRGGSLYGISSNSMWAAFSRHPNRIPSYRGLYQTGGSAHPGGGMPLAVLSGRIAADLAEKDIRI